MDHNILRLIEEETERVEKGLPEGVQTNLTFLATIVAKEAGETLSWAFKTKDWMELSDEKFWGVAHNAIQTASAAIRLLRFMQEHKMQNFENYDIHKYSKEK